MGEALFRKRPLQILHVTVNPMLVLPRFPGTDPCVIVALDNSPSSQDVLQFAFDETSPPREPVPTSPPH